MGSPWACWQDAGQQQEQQRLGQEADGDSWARVEGQHDRNTVTLKREAPKPRLPGDRVSPREAQRPGEEMPVALASGVGWRQGGPGDRERGSSSSGRERSGWGGGCFRGTGGHVGGGEQELVVVSGFLDLGVGWDWVWDRAGEARWPQVSGGRIQRGWAQEAVEGGGARRDPAFPRPHSPVTPAFQPSG